MLNLFKCVCTDNTRLINYFKKGPSNLEYHPLAAPIYCSSNSPRNGHNQYFFCTDTTIHFSCTKISLIGIWTDLLKFCGELRQNGSLRDVFWGGNEDRALSMQSISLPCCRWDLLYCIAVFFPRTLCGDVNERKKIIIPMTNVDPRDELIERLSSHRPLCILVHLNWLISDLPSLIFFPFFFSPLNCKNYATSICTG